MEILILIVTIGFLVAAYNFGRNVLFSLQSISQNLHSIYLLNKNIETEISELKKVVETVSGQKGKELIAEDLRKSLEKISATRA